MQWRQRNAQKSVRNLLLFCLSRYRRRRRCLSSPVTWYKNAGWDARQTKSWVCHSKCSFPLFRPYKGIQDSCEFWLPRRGLRVMDSDSLSVSLGFWTPIASDIPAPTSSITRGFQSLGFRIPQAKISWITDSANQRFPWILKSGFSFHGEVCLSRPSAVRASQPDVSISRDCKGLIIVYHASETTILP